MTSSQPSVKQTERPHPLTPLVRGWLILVALAIGWGREFVTSASGDQLEPGGLAWFLAVLAVVVLLAAIAGCSALDVEAITHKRAESTEFTVRSQGDKIRDEAGNHMTGLRISFEVEFPEGDAGDRAREMLPKAIEMSRDRLCTVSRTVQLGTDVFYDLG